MLGYFPFAHVAGDAVCWQTDVECITIQCMPVLLGRKNEKTVQEKMEKNEETASFKEALAKFWQHKPQEHLYVLWHMRHIATMGKQI